MKVTILFIINIFFINLLSAETTIESINKNAKSGDIIFQISKSRQAEALEEGTGSHWTHVGILFKENNGWVVYEAARLVEKVPLAKFIQMGKDDRVLIKRFKSSFVDLNSKANLAQLKKSLDSYLGLDYDIFFEWSDDLIYCSEYVYKAFNDAFSIFPGKFQKMKDFNLDGPLVKYLINIRYKNTGKVFNLEEPVLSPLSLFNDKRISYVLDSKYIR